METRRKDERKDLINRGSGRIGNDLLLYRRCLLFLIVLLRVYLFFFFFCFLFFQFNQLAASRRHSFLLTIKYWKEERKIGVYYSA